MDRIRTSISEKTKFSLPDRPKFSLPDRSKFHLPERPKFSFPDKSRFHLPDRSKFTIKKPSIRLADALARVKRPPSLREQQKQRSTESTAGSKRNIFDFATYPRIFDKKSKKRGEYATSSPKDSRAQSAESATFPRARKKKPLGGRWARHFGNSSSQDRAEVTATASDSSPPWHQTSIEEPQEPRLSVRTEEEIMAAARAIPWEDTRKRERHYDDEEIQYMDYEQEFSQEVSDRQPPPRRSHKASRRKEEEESYEHEEPTEEEDPRRYGDEEAEHVHRDEVEEEDRVAQDEWHADQQVMVDEKFRPILRSRSLDEDMPRALEEAGYEGAFMAVDPRRFRPRKMPSEEEEHEEELEEHEPSSAHSDREQQQSSGSSCDRRRRGVIEEIDSDEFFLRASGISQDDMNLGSYLPDEIRDALRAEIASALQDEEMPATPPQRPMRTLRKRREEEDSTAPEIVAPPTRPKRERGSAAARRSREASIIDEVFRERTRSDSRSDSRHRVVYQAEGAVQPDFQEQEPLDDIVVVKPARRRKSRSSLRSQSQPPMETSILSPSTPAAISPAVETSSSPFLATPPAVPVRRKRSHREMIIDRRNGHVAPICNGHREWEMEIVAAKKPATPVRRSRSRQSSTEQQRSVADGDVAPAGQEDVDKLIGQRGTVEPSAPVPPKRRSRSRTTSVAADEDRTSHGAESLPEAGYVEEDIPRDETSSARDLSGYAIVEKRERPPRPPPPRRKRDKFATAPRPIPPKRPQRAYSTLGPASRSRPDTAIASETISPTTTPTLLTADESIPYIEIDLDEMEHRDALRSGGMLDKIQGRPLPAPPRPPRARKEHPIVERPRTPFEFAIAETTAATQTDPLPDDMVIEEEVTQAKLIVTPSRSGSQVMVSMERIPSPSRTGTPPVPPLPLISHILRKEEEEEEEREDEVGRMAYDTVSLRSSSPMRETERASRHMSAPHLEARREEEELRARAIRSALFSDEPLRISSLEVGDLKVDRLSVSQIEAHKIMASEVDAMVIATSELRGAMEESHLSPAIIRELIAIRSHLETVATSQARERHHESEREGPVSRQVTDIPTSKDDSQAPASRERRLSQERPLQEVAEKVTAGDEVEAMRVEPPSVEDEEMPGEDQKVVKTDVLDTQDKEVSHTPSIAPPVASPESLLSQTLVIDQLESAGKDEPITPHVLTVTHARDTQDKSLRILDPEHPLTLSSRTTSESHVVDESRASFPPSSDVPTTRSSELRVSPERAAEPLSSSDQTTTTSTTATESTATSTCLRGSDKDDMSDSKEQQVSRKSRSRSPSPARGITRQTASPVRSLPPVISVTPDTPDTTPGHGIPADARPQRAVISYSSDAQHDVPKHAAQPQRAVISHSSDTGRLPQTGQRESSESPIPSSFPLSTTHFIAFPASEIPAQFFSLSDTPSSQRDAEEPGVIDTTQQLLRALRTAGIKAMRHFVRYLASTLSSDDTVEKVREVELAICALLLFIAGLLIYYFSSTRTVTYYHHWDYFNPPQ